MPPRKRMRMLAMGVLPAAATSLALATGAGPAGADTITRQHTFSAGNGLEATCTINLTRTFPFGADDQVGQGGTSISAGPSCTSGVALIAATYEDPDGVEVTTPENFDGNSTLRRYAPVGSNFTTIHRVVFQDCRSRCEFRATRSK